MNFEYKTDKSGLVVMGDTHGNWSSIVEFCQHYRDYCIIQVGDFGLGFYNKIKEYHRLKKLNKHLHDSHNELIAIRGNHDSPIYFHNKWVEEEILLSNDYTIVQFGDKRIQLIGGGISIDRSERIINRTWWIDEELKFDAERVEKVDILITHVSPTDLPLSKAEANTTVMHYHGVEASQGGDLLGELAHEQQMCQNLSDLTECKAHYFGHLHHAMIYINNEKNRKYVCLDINEIREIK